MTSGADIFGVVSGALGIVGVGITAYRKSSPTRAMDELDSGLKAAEAAVLFAKESGVIIDPVLWESLNNRIFGAAEYRVRITENQTFTKKFSLTLSGLALKIRHFTTEARQVRAEILFIVEYKRYRQQDILLDTKPPSSFSFNDIGLVSPQQCHIRESSTLIQPRTWCDAV